MSRLRATASIALGALGALAAVLAGCGVEPSGVTDAGEAPTGVAPGPTLYFVDEQGEVVPQLRESGRLGTIGDAVSLLLLGPGGSELRTEIAPIDTPTVEVTTSQGVVQLRLPLAADDVTPRGADQLVCTALGAHVQGGGATGAKVRLLFTHPAPASNRLRTCPVLG